jgi:putative transposase
MNRLPLEVADIVRSAGQYFIERSRKWINGQHEKVLQAITRCRTAALGGLAPDHSRWISSRRTFFLPIKVLSRVFRGKFVAGLKGAFQAGALQFHGHLLPLAEPRAFAWWLRVLFRHDWVIYSKRPFGGPEHVLRYLGAYTHRVTMSNSRLVALANGHVTFR